MERLALIDDWTSTGGRVMGASSTHYAEDGRRFALAEDKATCGNCKGLWPIAGTARDWIEDGRAMVKDLAPVYCPCGKNRIYASGNSPFLWFEAGDMAETVRSSTPAQTDDELERYFEIVDAASGAPVEGMTYKLSSGGHALVYEATLANGRTLAFSAKDHPPHLNFVAWIEGDVR